MDSHSAAAAAEEPTMKTLTGYDAINYARTHGLTLAKYADPTEGARTGLSPDEADEIASVDPSLVHIVKPAAAGGKAAAAMNDRWLGEGEIADCRARSGIEAMYRLVPVSVGPMGETAAGVSYVVDELTGDCLGRVRHEDWTAR